MAASGSAGNFQSIPALSPGQVPIPTTAGSVNMYMNLDDNLNIWTVDHFKVHRPIAGGGGLLQVTVPITAVQLQNAFTTPIQLIPAPGIGKGIAVINTAISFTANTIPFLSLFGRIRCSTALLTDAQITGILDVVGGVDTFQLTSPTNGSVAIKSIIPNDSLVLDMNTDSIGTGDGTAILYIACRIITL